MLLSNLKIKLLWVQTLISTKLHGVVQGIIISYSVFAIICFFNLSSSKL